MEEMRFFIGVVPRSKKNSQQIMNNRRTGRPFIMPSAAYKAYQKAAVAMIPAAARKGLDAPVNVRAVFRMPTRRACDLVNMLEALDDVLVDAGVLADDNCRVIAGHDGSRVVYDRDRPGTEVTITRMEKPNEDATMQP